MRWALLACVACSSSEPVQPVADAGLDVPAEAAGADAAKTFCQTQTAAFCADFEGGDVTWDGQDLAGGGAVALDEGALLVKTPVGTLGDSPRALLTKSLADATSIVMLWQAKIDPRCYADAGAGYAIALLQVGGWAASLVVSTANAQIMPVTPPSHLQANGPKAVMPALPAGEWMTLRLALDLTNKKFHFVLQTASDKRDQELAVTPGAGAIKARLGVDALLGTASQGCEIRYDDVLVTLR